MIRLSGSRARMAQSSLGSAASIEIWSTFDACELGQKRIAGRLDLHPRRIAEAEVERGGAAHAVDRAVDRRHGEAPRFLGARLQERLVELHHVGAGGEQVPDLLVQRRGAGKRQRDLIAVVLVVELLRHGERAGNGDLDRPVGIGAQERYVAHLHRLAAPDRPDHPRHDLDATRRARGDLRRVVAVRAVERGGEPVGVALAADLAVGDHVDAGALLVADREQRGVVLRLFEPGLLDPPQLARAGAGRDDLNQPLAVDQPVGLRIAADQRRRQQGMRGALRHSRPMRFPGAWLYLIVGRKSETPEDAGRARSGATARPLRRDA